MSVFSVVTVTDALRIPPGELGGDLAAVLESEIDTKFVNR